MAGDIIIRNVEIAGRAGLDVHLSEGRIASIGKRLPASAAELDGGGGALIAGLIDHHLHLLSWAAHLGSVDLAMVRTHRELEQALRSAAAAQEPGSWIRATGYHEGAAGVLTRHDLDSLCPAHKVRLQHRSGALWMLNTAALEVVAKSEQLPDFAERDEKGAPNGRFRRADAWLRTRLPLWNLPVDQASHALARCGVTGLTDASVTNDADTARLIAAHVANGALRQRVMLMGELNLPAAPEYALGAVKFLLDDASLPDLEDLTEGMRRAHQRGRPVAVHCVTMAELALALAALEDAGGAFGDRIEHGGEITDSAALAIRRLGLTVATQPAFVHDKGDRYLAECDDPNLLYRCGSLLRLGVKMCASSDAPYANADPWLAMRAAVNRRTRSGAILGQVECISAEEALGLYQGGFNDPGGPVRRVEVGAPADLCLLAASSRDTLQALDAGLVAATLVAGEVIYAADRA